MRIEGRDRHVSAQVSADVFRGVGVLRQVRELPDRKAPQRGSGTADYLKCPARMRRALHCFKREAWDLQFDEAAACIEETKPHPRRRRVVEQDT